MGWTPPPAGIAMCQGGDVVNHLKEGTPMDEVSII